MGCALRDLGGRHEVEWHLNPVKVVPHDTIRTGSGSGR